MFALSFQARLPLCSSTVDYHLLAAPSGGHLQDDLMDVPQKVRMGGGNQQQCCREKVPRNQGWNPLVIVIFV
jgi:hypothetical protein